MLLNNGVYRYWRLWCSGSSRVPPPQYSLSAPAISSITTTGIVPPTTSGGVYTFAPSIPTVTQPALSGGGDTTGGIGTRMATGNSAITSIRTPILSSSNSATTAARLHAASISATTASAYVQSNVNSLNATATFALGSSTNNNVPQTYSSSRYVYADPSMLSPTSNRRIKLTPLASAVVGVGSTLLRPKSPSMLAAGSWNKYSAKTPI